MSEIDIDKAQTSPSGFVTPAGFSFRFDNGWTVSIGYGRGHYGSNRGGDRISKPSSVEVGIFNDKLNTDTEVRGWQTPEEVAEILAEVAAR